MPFRDSPIKRKLRSVILMTCGIALLLTCTAFITYELVSFRRVATENLNTLAKIMAENSSASLAFRDEEDGERVLDSLSAEPQIVAAALYDEAGELFASYHRDQNASVPATLQNNRGASDRSNLALMQPVSQEGKRFGTLYLESDLSEVYKRLRLYVVIAILVLIGSLLVAFLISNLLQKTISAPIVSLARLARVVSEQHDYTARAKKESEDEIGFLTDAFNQMLGEIQENQLRLKKALSDTQQSEEQVKEMNLSLERRVRERTGELREAVANMEAFSYSVSHDLRGPLRSMHGYAAILLEDYGDKLDSDARHYLKRIADSAARMDNLIQDLLTYSRVARADLKIEPVDLDLLVRNVIEQNPAFQPPKAVIDVETPLAKILGHEAAMTQCLSNLLSNAVKFVPPGRGPHVKVRTTVLDSRVRLWVEDNGIGIRAEHFERVFRMFERVHSNKTYEGTGIGLAIVKKAVDRMGGKIGLESEEGRGTRFWIELPKA